MEFQVLGSLQVMRDGTPVYVANAHKPRLLLAILLANPGQVISVDRLVTALWGDAPPTSARQNLHQYVHRIRLALGPAILPRRPSGHGLPASLNIDSVQFAELVRAGNAAYEKRDYQAAASKLGAGLQLWRGEAFAEFADGDLIRPTVDVLEAIRRTAIERWAEAKIAAGAPDEVPPVLARWIELDPVNEHLRMLMMRSLAASGRQAEALLLYRTTRAALVEQLGIEPGPMLRETHEAILRGESLNPIPVTAVVPHELPANVAGFVGRAGELAELDSTLASNQDDPSGPVIISAIAGTAGVGKTALAIRWSHRVASRFPHGQLYLNLNGYSDSDPISPMAALSNLLASLGVPPDDVPTDVHSAAARYRTLLSGRQMLIVLDNARSAEQVRPLLPGHPGCLVLITSRDRLNGLVAAEGARRINLGTLHPEEAVSLLEHLIGLPRIAGEPQAVADLAKVCAYLPLALRIAGARVADQPHFRVGEYVAELRRENGALGLATDENAVAGAFQLSYLALGPPARRVFRCLGIVSLLDYTKQDLAKLSGLDEAATAVALEQLSAAHLMTTETAGRYKTHDLLRQYAAALAREEESTSDRTAAAERLFLWYMGSVSSAAKILHPDILRLPAPPDVPRVSDFRDRDAALEWLNRERHNVMAAVIHSARQGPRQFAWLLVDGLRGFQQHIQHSSERMNAARAAVAAARAARDDYGLAAAFHALAHACYGAGRYQSCLLYLRKALDASVDAGWLRGEAAIANNIAVTSNTLGDQVESQRAAERSLRIYHQLGNLDGEAMTLNNMAVYDHERGRLRTGLRHARRAFILAGNGGSNHVRSTSTLGELLHSNGFLYEALEVLVAVLERNQQAHAAVRAIQAKIALSNLLRDLADGDQARILAVDAIDSAVDLRESRLHVRALNALGHVDSFCGQPDDALRHHQSALAIASRISAPYEVTDAHLGAARAQVSLTQLDQARLHVAQALASARTAGFQVLEGQSLNLLTEVCLNEGDSVGAYVFASEALEMHHRTAHRPGWIRSRSLLRQISLSGSW